MFCVGLLYFRHKSYLIQMVSNSILLLQCKKISCMVYWGRGTEFNLSCQTRSFNFLFCFHMGSQCGQDLVLKSVWYNTSQHKLPKSPCLKQPARPPCPPPPGTEPPPPQGPKVMEPPNLGWLGSGGQVNVHVGCQLLRGDKALRTGVSTHEQFGSCFFIRVPHLACLPSGIFLPVELKQVCCPHFFSVQSHTSSTLILLEGGIYEFLLFERA